MIQPRGQRPPYEPASPARVSYEQRVGSWLKTLGVIVLVWLIVERVGMYLSHVAFAVSVCVGGVFVAYLIYPAVRWLRAHMPLWAAIAIMYGAFAIAAGATLWYVVPIALSDLEAIAASVPALERELQRFLDTSAFAAHLPPAMAQSLRTVPLGVATYVQANAHLVSDNVVPALLSAVTIVALFIAIPVVAAYMIYEAVPIQAYLLAALPADRREGTRTLIRALDEVVGGFVRGQVLVALTVGIMTTILLLVLRVPYALLIGIWAGILDLVPYLGAAAGAIPGVAIALLTNGVADAAAASIGFAVMYQIEGNFISPRIVSRAMRISPLVVIFAVVAGGEAFGLIGMLVAVPIAGAIRIVLEYVQAIHRDPIRQIVTSADAS